MKAKEIKEVVDKLCGPIDPVGDSHIDDKRYKNLETRIAVTDMLLGDIFRVSGYARASMASSKRAGKKALHYLQEVIDV